MSLRRLAATTAVMAVTAALLLALTPGLPDPAVAADPQAFVDAAGPDALVVGAAAGLAWLAWGWGVLGLVLTALSAAPGIVGAFARGTGRLLLPATARRAAALALGVGLAVGSPALSACSTAAEPPAAGAAGAGPAAAIESLPLAGPVPDWPTGQPPTAQPPSPPSPAATVPTPPLTTPVPDWPSGDHPAGQQPPGALPASEHVVVRGDCLWDIAAADLRTRTGGEPAAPDVARAAEAWWRANAGVLGSDPDLLLPGQVLRAPAAPPVPLESETPR